MTDIDLSAKSSSELVEMYNAKADLLDMPKVKRFADRATAEKRVNQIIARIGSVNAASTGKNEETKPLDGDVLPPEGATTEGATEGAVVVPSETDSAESNQPGGDAANKEGSDDMAKTAGKTRRKATGAKAAGNKAPRKATGAKKREAGEMVNKGSYREKLLGILTDNKGKQVPISKLLVKVYGENRKDYKGPLMMVMKGLKAVLAANKTGMEIRKTRENKENHFGLHKKGS